MQPLLHTSTGAAMGTSPHGVIHTFPGGTKEMYEASIAAVHPGPGELPKGQIFHAAGPSAEGWTITAVHDSKESWEAFRDQILMPRMQAGIPGGFTMQPVESTFDVANLVTSKGKQIVLT